MFAKSCKNVKFSNNLVHIEFYYDQTYQPVDFLKVITSNFFVRPKSLDSTLQFPAKLERSRTSIKTGWLSFLPNFATHSETPIHVHVPPYLPCEFQSWSTSDATFYTHESPTITEKKFLLNYSQTTDFMKVVVIITYRNLYMHLF